MKIKPENFLRLLLSIPYLGWGLAVVLSFLISGLTESLHITSAVLETIATVIGVYAVGIILWGIPYTLLVLGLLLWSRKKPAHVISKVFLFSPLLFSLLMALEAALITFPSEPMQSTPLLQGWMNYLSYSALLVVPSIVFGYFFIVIGLLVYRSMSRMNLLKAETEPIQN